MVNLSMEQSLRTSKENGEIKRGQREYYTIKQKSLLGGHDSQILDIWLLVVILIIC